jgi:hypothetical protein
MVGSHELRFCVEVDKDGLTRQFEQWFKCSRLTWGSPRPDEPPRYLGAYLVAITAEQRTKSVYSLRGSFPILIPDFRDADFLRARSADGEGRGAPRKTPYSRHADDAILIDLDTSTTGPSLPASRNL